MKKFLALAITFCTWICFHSQNTYAFFGSFNWDKNTEGIYVYELDTIKGKLSKVTSYTGISNPSFITLSPDGKYIFACTESKTENGGSVSSFEFNPENKSLTLSANKKVVVKIQFI